MKNIPLLASVSLLIAGVALPLVATAADKKGTFGAIAYSEKTQQYGIGAGETSAEAKKNAISFCKSSDCEVVVEYKDDCAALAISKDGGYYGTGEADSKGEAKVNAMKFCSEKGKGCEIVVADCTADE